jgi:hypothetical protein
VVVYPIVVPFNGTLKVSDGSENYHYELILINSNNPSSYTNVGMWDFTL